ncbi:MAG TPA: YjbE family putative metal transport protein [Caulobacteraceae bacterium]|jgi:YjbE family integral membrane protein|nr:YjbE family putative metal transport protein [Caulobacteraceae bacterium]
MHIPLGEGALAAFAQVVMIDLVLAGDNAVAVGMVAAGVEERQRRKVIVLGLGAAVVLLIGFALIATQLLRLVGLLLAGGVLLLWVCWKMWRELRAEGRVAEAAGEAALRGHAPAAEGPPKSFRAAFVQILLADLAMSLDNVLAVAGAARDYPVVLVGGLLLSITLMGLAANAIARLLQRHRWIGYVGLAIVGYVALHMIWQGHRDLVIDLNETVAYDAAMPFAPITPQETAKRLLEHGAKPGG